MKRTHLLDLSLVEYWNHLFQIGGVLEDVKEIKDDQSVGSSQVTSTNSQATVVSNLPTSRSQPASHTGSSVMSVDPNNPQSLCYQQNIPGDGSDEQPRTYATEDTPLTGISRVSSLSSLLR